MNNGINKYCTFKNGIFLEIVQKLMSLLTEKIFSGYLKAVDRVRVVNLRVKVYSRNHKFPIAVVNQRVINQRANIS